MTTIDFDDMRYSGRDGEEVNVTVAPEGTAQIVTFTLDGDTRPLPPGQSVRFRLRRRPGGQQTVLQMTFDFSDKNNGGSYRVGLTRVEEEPGNESVYTVSGTTLTIRTFRFSVQ